MLAGVVSLLMLAVFVAGGRFRGGGGQVSFCSLDRGSVGAEV